MPSSPLMPKIGIVLPIADEDDGNGVPAYAQVRDVALAAEAAGFDSVWVFDHLLFRGGGEESGIHECWTILAAIAETTQRVQLGTIVLCTGFRNAALQAKMAATLDHVSGGRLIFGIGSGWHDPEFEAFGYPTDHKVGRFAESLDVITSLIRTGRSTLDGRWVTTRDAVLLPPARPDLPLLIAAKGHACSSSRLATRTPGTSPGSGCLTSASRASAASCSRPATASVAIRRRSRSPSASRPATALRPRRQPPQTRHGQACPARPGQSPTACARMSTRARRTSSCRSTRRRRRPSPSSP